MVMDELDDLRRDEDDLLRDLRQKFVLKRLQWHLMETRKC